ncbi:MAG: hypothetical protein ACOYU3_07430 [Bacillota bacterium]
MTITVDLEQAQQVINLLKPPVGALNPEIETALPMPDDITGHTSEEVVAQTPVPQTPPAAVPVAAAAPLPTTAPTYTQEQIALAAAQIMDAGRQTDLIQLLGSFGVQAVTQLPAEQYGAFATSLRSMGARI